jgi:predicted O-methyltransferase YrrM
MKSLIKQDVAIQQVRSVLERLVRNGSTVALADGTKHSIFPVAVNAEEGATLRNWVVQENATQTIEIGLGYGISALNICAGLVANDPATARHVVIDPFQSSRFANCGRQALEEAEVWPLVEHHADRSEFVLPQLLKDGRQFDLAFVDGNHRFDHVFVDLFYLGRLVRKGGVIMLDDYQLPGIKRAVAFFTTNLGWTIAETSPADDDHQWVVLRTANQEDTRDFRYFAEF